MIPPIRGWGRTAQAEATPFKWRLLDTESQACSKPQGYPSISELTQSCEVGAALLSLLPGKEGSGLLPGPCLTRYALMPYSQPLSTTRSEETVWLPACIPGSELSPSLLPLPLMRLPGHLTLDGTTAVLWSRCQVSSHSWGNG